MTTLPLNKRDYDLFLSHAHVDRDFVAGLDSWLKTAGFSVSIDARNLAAGSLVATELQRAIERCRGVVLVASENSMASGWVLAEYNSAMAEFNKNQGFRMVALRLQQANVDKLMQGTLWIDLPEKQLDLEAALAIVRALYPHGTRPVSPTVQDAYVSLSWHPEGSQMVRLIGHALADEALRLIGDAPDQKRFDPARIADLMRSCGFFVGILPYRDEDTADTAKGEYRYFLREMDIAAEVGLPSVIIADPRIRRTDGSDGHWLRMDTAAKSLPNGIERAIKRITHDWVPPEQPHYVFCAMDLDSTAAAAGSAVREIIEQVTGLPTVVGNEVQDDPIQRALIDRITKAFLVLADITDDNLNTCIEAGMALATRRTLKLISRGKPRRPPFMLRDHQMPTYENDVELIGVLHRILKPYRRRIINAEL